MLKDVRNKVDHYWTRTKKCLAALSVWGLIFSLVTIGHLGVAFDYDDTLVFSGPAFQKAYAESSMPYTAGFWSVVNRSYDLEKTKVLPYLMAWAFRLFGFRVSVITSRPSVDSDGLKKEWRHLVRRGGFVFVSDKDAKHQYLESGNYLLYFGDSDSDVQQARRAHVLPVRVRRSRQSLFKEDYHPGLFRELVMPLSEYSWKY